MPCFAVVFCDHMIQLTHHVLIVCVCVFTDSVQQSLEAKFSSGQSGAIPITPSPEFTSRIAVSYVTNCVISALYDTVTEQEMLNTIIIVNVITLHVGMSTIANVL